MKKFFVLAVLASVFTGCGDIITDDAYNEAYMEDAIITNIKKDNYYYGTFVLYFADKLMPQKIAVRVVDDEVFTIQEINKPYVEYTWAIDKVLKDHEGYWDENYLNQTTFAFDCTSSLAPKATLSFTRENQSEDSPTAMEADYRSAISAADDKYKTQTTLLYDQYRFGLIDAPEYEKGMMKAAEVQAEEKQAAEAEYKSRMKEWEDHLAIWLFSLIYQNKDLDVISLEFEDKNNPETKFTKADYLNEKNNREKRYITKIRTNTGETIESSFYK